jgi:hypothetical protein
MKIAQLILEYINALIYPALIFSICLYFKDELKGILNGKITANYKDLAITVERQKAEIETGKEKAELVVQSIEKAKESSGLGNLSVVESSDNYLDIAIKLLELSPDEYKIIHALQYESDSGINKEGLICSFLGSNIDLQTSYGYRRDIEVAIDSLLRKGIISKNKGNIQFAHKLFKELTFKNNGC